MESEVNGITHYTIEGRVNGAIDPRATFRWKKNDVVITEERTLKAFVLGYIPPSRNPVRFEMVTPEDTLQGEMISWSGEVISLDSFSPNLVEELYQNSSTLEMNGRSEVTFQIKVGKGTWLAFATKRTSSSYVSGITDPDGTYRTFVEGYSSSSWKDPDDVPNYYPEGYGKWWLQKEFKVVYAEDRHGIDFSTEDTIPVLRIPTTGRVEILLADSRGTFDELEVRP